MRRFLVKPAAMYWPGLLPTVALFKGFHTNEKSEWDTNGKSMSRIKMFWIGFSLMFAYTWIPDYFLTVLQAISLMCLLTSNPKAKLLGSVTKGVGLGSITFDWQFISSAAMSTPFSVSLQATIGTMYISIISNFRIWGWVLIPIMYYYNAFGADQRIPVLNTSHLFSDIGKPFDPLELMDMNTCTYILLTNGR
jgi:hypothetical protein